MSPKFTDALAGEVRARRARLRLSQSELADLAGVSERFVRYLERGKPTVQLDSVSAVLETLGLELSVRTRQGTAKHDDGGHQEGAETQ